MMQFKMLAIDSENGGNDNDIIGMDAGFQLIKCAIVRHQSLFRSVINECGYTV